MLCKWPWKVQGLSTGDPPSLMFHFLIPVYLHAVLWCMVMSPCLPLQLPLVGYLPQYDFLFLEPQLILLAYSLGSFTAFHSLAPALQSNCTLLYQQSPCSPPILEVFAANSKYLKYFLSWLAVMPLSHPSYPILYIEELKNTVKPTHQQAAKIRYS